MKVNFQFFYRLLIFWGFLLGSTPCLSQAHDAQIFHGERIHLEDREFSIVPPWGWEVYRDFNGATLFFQVPREDGQLYQRNIRVMAFNGPRYIDEMTFQNFGQELVERSSRMSNAVSDYRLRNQMPIEIAGGRKAGLYYAEFKIQDVSLMQMHILVSSARFHFLMTYTDLAEHFESNDSTFLNEAFASLQSVELAGAPPKRTSYFYYLIVGLGGLFVSLLALKIFLSMRVKSLAKGIDEFGEDEVETDDGQIKVDESYISGLNSKSKKKEKEKKAGFFAKRKSKEASDDEDLSAVSELEEKPKKKRIRVGGSKPAVDEFSDIEVTTKIADDDDGGWNI